MSSTPDQTSLSYRDAGVDIDAGDALVERIKPLARATLRPEVLAGIGGFGALCALPSGYREPVLVTGTDGVGTKVKLAFELDRHDTVGIDLVAMSVNDILVQGAEPLFFLDYFACGKLDVDVATRVVAGIAAGCTLAGCSLIGGETAEMPGMYRPGEYDLAGFAVGVVEKTKIINGRSITAGDIVLGLASSGAHSNGYSLIRRILEQNKTDLTQRLHDRPLSEALLAPTRIYVKSILQVIEQLPVKGLAHITGGGLLGNIPRILPSSCAIKLDRTSWPMPPLFLWLQQQGRIEDREMFTVFNCGIGMVMVVDPAHANDACDLLRSWNETVWRIGEVVARSSESAPILVE